MKKITLLITLFIVTLGQGQTFSTGTIQLFPEYSVKIDVTSSLVTLTQIMPSDRWYALAFNNSSMLSGDIIAFINTANISDRQLGGFGVPAADAVQSWTTISNTLNGTVRTVVSTRALNTGEAGDYVFSASAGSINLAAARAGNATFSLAAHGGSANAATTAAFGITLDNSEFDLNSFTMYPNPSTSATTIQLPHNISKGTVKVYDNLGRVVLNQEISNESNELNTSSLPSGNYLVVLRTDYGNATKTLLVE
jgi:hypothetical protein